MTILAENGLDLKDTESAIAYLKHLSPDENRGASQVIAHKEALSNIEEGKDAERRTLSERVCGQYFTHSNTQVDADSRYSH